MSYLAKNYSRRKIAFKKGKGTFLYDYNGNRYIDFLSGIAVNTLGHAHPYLNKALTKQSRKLWHVSNSFLIPEGERLAKRLANKTFADKVIFVNSGAEANEAAIKVARRYFYSLGKKKKNRILCVKNSFHGRTIANIFASGSKKMTEGFGPKVAGFDHFSFGDLDSLKKKIKKNTAAIFFETAMGESGIKVHSTKFLKQVKKICNQKKILLILDEVQCGIGRSGKFFAYEYSNVKPDIVPIAKGIGGGYPIGAVLMTKKVSKCMVPGTHGSTFGGNPLAMAVGNAILDKIFEKNFLKNVRKNSKYFIKKLHEMKIKYPKIINEVRGIGLLLGLKLNVELNKFISNLTSKKLLTIRAAENVVRILPPLNVKKTEIDAALKIIDQVCSEYK
tara:strand:+ start:813 stop:1979 length:1167 start_codon:yes stop_codon:yes gene_type:complete